MAAKGVSREWSRLKNMQGNKITKHREKDTKQSRKKMVGTMKCKMASRG